MKKIIIILFTLVSFVSAHTIGTSIAPIYDILSHLTQKADQCFFVVSKNQDPHTFSLKPQDMQKLSKADLFVQVGFGFDNWANFLNTQKIILSEHISPIAPSKDKKTANPHFWLSPKQDIIILNTLYSFLTNAYPQKKNIYKTNYNQFLQYLKILDKQYSTLASTIPFVTSHPVLNYVARDYNLNFKGVLYRNPGTEPTPRDVKSFLKRIKKYKIKTLFLKTGFPRNKIDPLFHSPLNVYLVDPIGIHSNSIMRLLRENFNSLKRGLH